MKRCLNCGKISGSYSSVMQECRCQYSMQAPTPPIATQHERKPLTDEEAIILKGATCPEVDWKARHGIEMNNGERNQWMLEWFMAFKVAIEAAHGIKE